MAGFDFTIPVVPNERTLAKTLLRVCQRTAQQSNIEFHYEWNGISKSVKYNHYYVTIDGDFTNIQILLRQLAPYVIGFSDGYVAASQTIKKSMIGRVIMTALAKAIFDFQEVLSDVAKEIPLTTPPLTINSFIFDFPENSGLHKSGAALTAALLGYHTNSVSAEQLIEQLHTTS